MERKEIMDLVSGKSEEITDLGSGKPEEVTGHGSGELDIEDYPLVRRLRNRRLLVYLWLQGFDAAYDSVVHESGVQMSRLHLRQLLVWGRWSEALDYIRRFLPTALNDRSLDAQSLLFFLHTLWALANVAACSTDGLVSDDSVHSDLSFLRTLASTNAKLASILRYTLHSPQFRASLDWMLVRKKASLIVDDWALETPELRRKLQLPGGPGLPQNLLPIGPLCPRSHRREQSRRAKASTIAKSYLNRKRSLPPPSPHPEGLPEDALSWVPDLIEGCLRAGKLLELHQGCPLQSNAKEAPTERKEIMDLVSGKPMETIALGSGKLHDCPSVRRLRNRRLLIYLRLQGFDTAYDSVVRESGVQMSKLHLRQLLIWGRWSEALNYIRRFLPPASKDRGREARCLVFFLHMLRALDNVSACSKSGLLSDSAHRDLRFLTTLCSRSAKLSSILRHTLQPPQFREPLDWMLVREKASLIVDAWALQTPELRRNLQLPGGPGLPRDVLPIRPNRPRRHRRERYRRAKASTIAKSYLNRKRSLLSPSPPPGLLDDALNWMADLIERCLLAGKIPELHQEQPLQSNANEGASGSPLSQTMFGTVTDPSKNPGISSVTNAGAPSCTGRPKCSWCSSVAISGAAVSQPFRTPWITSASNAGPIKHSVGRKRNSGEVLMTVEEDDPDRKRQLTELELVTEMEAESCSANLMAN